MKIFTHPTPLADEYTLGFWLFDPVMRPSCGLLALPHVGLDILLISYLRLVIHSSPTVVLGITLEPFFLGKISILSKIILDAFANILYGMWS